MIRQALLSALRSRPLASRITLSALVLAAGCQLDPSVSGLDGDCPPAEVKCNGACVNPLTDSAFCGASGDCLHSHAGEACGAGQSCQAGVCEPNSQQPPEVPTPVAPCSSPQPLVVIDATDAGGAEAGHEIAKAFDGAGFDDGDADSRWAHSGLPTTVIFDLGAVQKLCTTRFSFYKFNSGRIYTYSVAHSVDGGDYQTAVDHGASAATEWTEAALDAVDARYVQLTIHAADPSTNWAGLWETEFAGTGTGTPVVTPPPEVTLQATSSSISSGDATTLTWTSEDAVSCTGTGFSTGAAISGQTPVSPTSTTEYSVQCAGPGGLSTLESVTVTVTETGGGGTATYFSEDFESASWGSKFKNISTGVNLANISRETGVAAHSGSYGLRVHVPNGQHYGGAVNYDFSAHGSGNLDEVWGRYYVKFGPNWKRESYAMGKAGFSVRSDEGCGAECLEMTDSHHYTRDGTDLIQGISYHHINMTDQNDIDNTFQYSGDPGTTWKGGLREREKWYCVETHFKINTPNVKNGVYQNWLNGDLVSDLNNLRYRNTDTFDIDGASLKTYIGGGWVADRDMNVYFDDWAVSDKRIGCD